MSELSLHKKKRIKEEKSLNILNLKGPINKFFE